MARTLLLILDHQAEDFERKAAELNIEIRKMERSTGSQAYYCEVLFYTPADLYYLGMAVGHKAGLQAAHQPTNELLN